MRCSCRGKFINLALLRLAYLLGILEDLDDDVALVAAELPLGPRRLVEHEDAAPLALEAVRDAVAVLPVRAGGVRATVAPESSPHVGERGIVEAVWTEDVALRVEN